MINNSNVFEKYQMHLYRDSFQNYKVYQIPKAQLIIADVPYNLGTNAYGSNPMWYIDGDRKKGESNKAGKKFFNSENEFRPAEFMHFCSKMLVKEPKEKVCAEIEIQVVPEREHGFDALADRIYRFPQVRSLYLMSGGYDLKVIIEGDSLQEVASFVSNKLSTLDGVRATKTSFILKTYKENDIVYVEQDRDNREGVTA